MVYRHEGGKTLNQILLISFCIPIIDSISCVKPLLSRFPELLWNRYSISLFHLFETLHNTLLMCKQKWAVVVRMPKFLLTLFSRQFIHNKFLTMARKSGTEPVFEKQVLVLNGIPDISVLASCWSILISAF